MEEKKTSIIVPVYNVEKYLAECLDTLLAQSEKNIEIIAVNDGSLDQSRTILSQYQQKDDRIIVVDKENGGLSDARNVGIEKASGEYLVFVDSDDAVHEDYVRELKNALEGSNSDIAVCDMAYFYEDGTKKKSSGGSFDCTNCLETPELIAINNSACNKMFKKELFDDCKFPYGKLYEDLALIPILLYKANRVVKVDKPLYFYRQRSGSIAHSSNPKIFDIYDAIDGLIEYVGSHGNEPLILRELYKLYVIHGLDLTTLRIKDFDDKAVREDYLRKNMERLNKSYPYYKEDPAYKSAGVKKKLIFELLNRNMFKQVLKIYDR